MIHLRESNSLDRWVKKIRISFSLKRKIKKVIKISKSKFKEISWFKWMKENNLWNEIGGRVGKLKVIVTKV